jgi:hydrogenase nickel incorporation protein HypA/HybF
MHEWALAEAVVETAKKAAKHEKMKKVTGIKVRLGELQHIEQEIFASALEAILKQAKTPLEDADVELEVEKARFHCRVCAQEWDLTGAGLDEDTAEAIHFLPEMAHVYMRCPGCGSPDFSVVKGRGLWLASLSGVH